MNVTGDLTSEATGDPVLLGAAEAAAALGMSRQALSNLRSRDDMFPPAVAELAMGPVFDPADIRRYHERTQTPLAELLDQVDVTPRQPFDPRTPISLALQVAGELMRQPAFPVLDAPRSGAGVYVISYVGGNELYAPADGAETHLYAGVAAATDMVGLIGELTGDAGPRLYNRMRRNAQTLRAVCAAEGSGLSPDDFVARALPVSSWWAQLAQVALVAQMKPVWNVTVTGFDAVDPGGPAATRAMPDFDVLHPGRTWASRHWPASATRDELAQRIRQHLRMS
jgi:hypothetical protein